MLSNLTRTSTPSNKYCIFLLLLMPFVLSCGKIEGYFAWKKPLQTNYRQFPARLEIREDKEIHWVYILKKPINHRKTAIVLMKKNIVWVDINTRYDYVDRSKTVIYGTIKDLKPGQYKILINDLKENKTVDQLPFTVYEKDKEDL